MNRILIVEDDLSIAEMTRLCLVKNNYICELCHDGAKAAEMIENKAYDLVLLDVMLPKLTGFEVCQQIREFSNVPSIMLTAKTEDMDKILGLEYGADDYLTKPFNILELKARIKAILRRVTSQNSAVSKPTVSAGGIELDYNLRRVKIGNKVIELTAKEFDLCDLFVTNPGKVYSRENLLDIVWGYDYPGDIRTVDVHVRRLREKIEPDAAAPTYILTKWGVGYYFKEN